MVVQLRQHAQESPDCRRLIVEEIGLWLAEDVRKSQTVEIEVQPLKDPSAFVFRHLLADLSLLMHFRVSLLRMCLQLPSIVDFGRSDFELQLRLALKSVTPFLCPVLSANGYWQLDLDRHLAIIGDLGYQLMFLRLQAHRVVADQRMHFVVLNVLVLMLIELGDVLRRHLEADALEDLKAQADG